MQVRVEHLREGCTGRPKDKNLSRAAGHPHVCRSLSTGGRFSHLSPHTCRLSCCHWPCMAPGTWLGGSSQQPTWPAPREGSPGPVGQPLHRLAHLRGTEQRGGPRWRAVCVPGRRAAGVRGLDRAMPISVIPYLSSRVWPVMFFHFSSTGRGRAADPETINLAGKSEATLVSAMTLLFSAREKRRKTFFTRHHYFKIHDINYSWGYNVTLFFEKNFLGIF